MKETDFKYYHELSAGDTSFSKIPVTIARSDAFKSLCDANIISITKAGRGKLVKIINEVAYAKFLATHFPDDVIGNSRAANISRLRNSKAGKRESSNISFLRGSGQITVNGFTVALEEYTRKYGLFSAYNPTLTIEKLCLVENLESFLNAEKLFNTPYTYLHKYGRVGTEFLKRIQTNEVMVFSDFDLIGLNEYLKVKEVFPGATLFVPANFDNLFERYSTPLPEKQLASALVKSSTDPVVIRIREMVLKSNRFLEQEILLLTNAG